LITAISSGVLLFVVLLEDARVFTEVLQAPRRRPQVLGRECFQVQVSEVRHHPVGVDLRAHATGT
jgi:hypothetical protein